MDSGLLDMLQSTVRLEPITSRDTYGAPVYGDAQLLAAFIRLGENRTVDRDGREVLARGLAYVDGDAAATFGSGQRMAESVISLPDTYHMPEKMPVLKFDVFPDETGTPHHTRIAF